jgi:hypothetical protein
VRPRVLVPALSEAAEALVLTLLAKKPELRFESMDDVEQAMLAIAPEASAGEGSVAGSRGREGSGPVVRRRDSSGPMVRRRESSGRHRDVAPPDDASGPISAGIPWGDGTIEDPVRPATLRRRSEPHAASPGGTSSSDMDLGPVRRWEWGTIATVVLLVLLLGAGIASVVLRQQGIELRWPWSAPEAPAPGGDPRK